MNNLISQIYESSIILNLNQLACLHVHGRDCHSFLDGQLTTNILAMEKNQFKSFCRLSPKGRIKFNGYICVKENGYILITEKKETEKLKADLDMFIISEEVDINILHQMVIFSTDLNFLKKYTDKDRFNGRYNFLPGFLTLLEDDSDIKLEKNSMGDLIKKVFSLLDYNTQGSLFNEALESLYSDYKDKGCFVGQEVVNKINNNRGSRKFPVLFSSKNLVMDYDNLDVLHKGNNFGNIINSLNIDNCQYSIVSVLREFRKSECNIELKIGDDLLIGSIDLFEDLFDKVLIKVSEQYFLEAVDALNKDRIHDAELLLKISIAANEKNIESIEALGVMYGQKKDYKKAHLMMDKLLFVDPTSVMAHTNKSLFFMNEGKIEEAEIEKDFALKKGVAGDLGNYDREIVEKERLQKVKKQLEMYLEVLDIDPEDDFALSKSLELLLEIKEFSKMEEIFKAQNKPLPPFIFALQLSMYKSMGADYSFLMDEFDQKVNEALKLGDTKASKMLELFKK